MSLPRKFKCGEADYLTAYGVPLKTAAEYHVRFGPRAVVELYEAGIPASVANQQDPRLNSLQIIAHLTTPE